LKKLLLIILIFLVVGCISNETPKEVNLEESDLLPILGTDFDFNDWKNDFTKGEGQFPELKTVLLVKLSEEKISEMIESVQEGQRAVKEQILSNIDVENKSVFYVEMIDQVNSSRGIIAIIDAKEKKVLKFFATLGIESNWKKLFFLKI